MDFSQVRAITIPEGNVTRILSGATVLWKKPGGLPTEYQQVEYIEGTGTQYIDLPFGFDDTDTIEARFSINTSMSSDKYVNSPKTWNNNNNRFGMGVHSASVTGYCVGFGSRATNNTFLSPRTQNDGEFHTWTYSNRGFSISELGCSLNVSNITFGGTTANLRLFYGYNAPTKCRIASYHHVKTGAKYDLIPCYRKSDNVAGLYDMVNNVFYTNAGTGVFTVGPEIISLPSEYQQVACIESSGTQYIDTGVLGDGELQLKCKLNITRIRNGSPFFGSYGNSQRCYFLIQNSNKAGYAYIASTYSSTALEANRDYDINVIFKIGEQQLYVDNSVVLTTAQTGTLRTGKNIYLFGYNFDGRLDSTRPISIKLYNAKLYKDNVLVRNFIPCYRKLDNVAGLYDAINDVFYTNSGTGSFTMGQEVFPLPSGYQQVEYIESDGSQYIDTGVIGKTGLHIVTEMGYATLTSTTTLFGSRDPRFFVTLYPSTTIDIGYNGDNQTGINAESRKIYNIDFDTSTSPARFGIDGSYITSNNQVDTNRNIYIFGCNRNGAVAALSKSIFKSMTITDENGGLLRKFVPCYRIADSEIGLYDLVSATFFTNSGSGTFIKGADVT